ncbi:hypothetical protein PBOR_28480 [Paenibacillus borealis]|uniref:Uncharacterized protein n=2 Tax=Paenibacillus borealis TaxID=160799 RepID=A0A089LG30_PAEBO|nr:hypothetical protein PBOR_28480 [Paenibacillus borealis]
MSRMNKQRSYTGLITVIYIAVLAVTVFSFFMLGFSESLMRFVVTLLAVCIAETVVYGYSVFWLRTAPDVSRTSPLLLSGAWIVGLYVAVVIASAVLLDWLLELSPLWYAGVQLIVLVAAVAVLEAIGLYGRNAASQEQRDASASRNLRRHRQELHEIRELAGTWKHPESIRLTELVGTLEEVFQYSDPISSPELSATEDVISQQISLLHDHVALLLVLKEPPADWDAETQELTDSIASTLQRRNRELAALK